MVLVSTPRRGPGPSHLRHLAGALALAGVLAVFAAAVPASADTSCRYDHPPIRSLDLDRYYTDAAGTEIDARKRAAKRAAVAPLKAFMIDLAKAADSKLNKACALLSLTDWAKADALLGEMPTKQAKYERNWALAGIATSYLKLRPSATEDQRRTIDAWLIRLADRSKAFLDAPGRKRNNHLYWLGLGLASTGLATGNHGHWTAARAIMQEAADSIQPDGTLPLELARGRRALHYHNFAAQPLFVMTLLARARDEDWAALNDGAFHRLVGLLSNATTQRERSDPIFPSKGGPQEPIKPKDFAAGWHLDYLLEHPDRHERSRRQSTPTRATRASRPSNDHRLGGDIGRLQQALTHYRR